VVFAPVKGSTIDNSEIEWWILVTEPQHHDAYALWIVLYAVLCVTLLQSCSTPDPLPLHERVDDEDFIISSASLARALSNDESSGFLCVPSDLSLVGARARFMLRITTSNTEDRYPRLFERGESLVHSHNPTRPPPQNTAHAGASTMLRFMLHSVGGDGRMPVSTYADCR
jgi:hypothetical protein